MVVDTHTHARARMHVHIEHGTTTIIKYRLLPSKSFQFVVARQNSRRFDPYTCSQLRVFAQSPVDYAARYVIYIHVRARVSLQEGRKRIRSTHACNCTSLAFVFKEPRVLLRLYKAPPTYSAMRRENCSAMVFYSCRYYVAGVLLSLLHVATSSSGTAVP